MKRDSYMTARVVRRELSRLGLDKAERILVKTCGDCPCWSDCCNPGCGAGAVLAAPGKSDHRDTEPPPHDCPLRTRALSIAIDPEV